MWAAPPPTFLGLSACLRLTHESEAVVGEERFHVEMPAWLCLLLSEADARSPREVAVSPTVPAGRGTGPGSLRSSPPSGPISGPAWGSPCSGTATSLEGPWESHESESSGSRRGNWPRGPRTCPRSPSPALPAAG